MSGSAWKTFYEDLGGKLGPRHAWTQQVIAHLVRLYQNWKRPAPAAAWQAKATPSP